MPIEPTPPSATQSPDDPMVVVLQKIEFVCRRIVQGQSATKLTQMRWYRICTVLTVVLSVFGSAGLAKKQVDWLAKSEHGPVTNLDWLIVGVALFGLLATIILELYRAFGIDKKALQAISAEASFSRLLMELENALECDDPRPNLDQVVRDAKTLGTNFHDVLKEPDPAAVQRFERSTNPSVSEKLDVSSKRTKGEGAMNRLPENKHFVANVHGTLCARFHLDKDRIHTEVDPDGTTYYQIDLLFVPQKPAARTIEDVTFYLDDTYFDSLRLAQKLRDGSYQATISSYGDFVITVEVTIDGRRYLQQMWLADMLEAGYADSIPSPEILGAIKDIRAN